MAGSKGIPLRGIGSLPIQVPEDILLAQQQLGVIPVLLWINLLAFSQKGAQVNIEEIAGLMGISRQDVGKALALLADYGWINDEGYEICLSLAPAKHDQPLLEPTLDQEQADFERLIEAWSAHVAPPSQEEMLKLSRWIEQKHMSPQVIQVAIELCALIDKPNFGYLEGILENWYREGIENYDQLMSKPHLIKGLNHAEHCTVHPEAQSKWKELFPDEFI